MRDLKLGIRAADATEDECEYPGNINAIILMLYALIAGIWNIGKMASISRGNVLLMSVIGRQILVVGGWLCGKLGHRVRIPIRDCHISVKE